MSQQLTFVLFFIFVAMIAIVGLTLFLLKRKKHQRTDGQYYESKQGPIFYKVYGHKGPALLLIHGLGASLFCWRHVIPQLTQDHRVIAVDLWGFGHSSKTMKDKMTLDTQVEVLMDLLDHLNVDDYNIVGHSMGAEIGLWMSHIDQRAQKCVAITPAAHPNLVADWLQMFHWVANLTPLVITPHAIHRLLSRSLEDSSSITEEMVQSYYQPYLDPAAHHCFAAALNIIKDSRVWDNLEHMKSNIYVIWAAHDLVISRKLVRMMTKKFHSKKTVTHPWAGHLPMEDDPHWLSQKILEHLKS